MGREPGCDLWMGVCPIVVEDERDLPPSRSRPVDALQEGQELAVPVARQAGPHDGSLQHVEGGEQGGRAMAHIVVGLPSGDPRPQRQDRLRALQGLDLTLLVHAQDQGLVGRMEVDAPTSRSLRTQ